MKEIATTLGFAVAGTIVILATSPVSATGPEPFSVKVSLPPDLLTLISAESNASEPAVMQVGPIHSTSPDSGTCGNDWAQDEFDRYFQVKPNGDGTYRLYEKFKDGTFVTTNGPSPGSCDQTDGTPPGSVVAGIQGKMQGYLITDVACDLALGCPQTPTCGMNNELCNTTAGFIAAFFGTGATRNDQAYFFHYAGLDGYNNSLLEHEWKNASPNRGGNHGDIASGHCITPIGPPCGS